MIEKIKSPVSFMRILLLRKSKVHVDLRRHFHGFTVEQRRLVDPLLNGIDSRVRQQRMATDYVHTDYGAILSDDYREGDCSLYARLLGQRGIWRRDLGNKVRGLDV